MDRCPLCDNAVPRGTRFCGECGYPFPPSQPDASLTGGPSINNEAPLIVPFAQQGAARLIFKPPDGLLQEYKLDKEEFTIGRLSGDITLQDDDSVSCRHVVIRISSVG
jgi:hypothetical protein